MKVAYLVAVVVSVVVSNNDAADCVYCPATPKEEVCCERFYLNVYRDSDIDITASTTYGGNTGTDRAALFEVNEAGVGISGWAASTNDVNQWIQVDFGSPQYVTGVLLQGRGYCSCDQWVTSFRVLYSNDKEVFYSTETLEGTFDQNTIATRFFQRPIRARYIRINPLSWHGHISLRFDLLGCKSA